MAHAEFAQLALTSPPRMVRRPLQTLLAGVQQALNTQFDDYRHAARHGPGAARALQRLQPGVALLCELEELLLRPALSAARPPWPAPAAATDKVDALRQLSELIASSTDAHQPAVVAILEGMVQLHFATLDERLTQAEAAAMPWDALQRGAEAMVARWRAQLASAATTQA